MTDRTRSERRSFGDRLKRHKQNLPGGIALRVTLLVLFCLLILEFIGWVIGFGRDESLTEEDIATSVASQMINIVQLYEATPAGAQKDLIDTYNSPFFRVAVFETQPQMKPLPDFLQEEIDEHIEALNPIMTDRDFRMGFIQTKRNEIFQSSEFSQDVPVTRRFWLGFTISTADDRVMFFALPPDDDLWNVSRGPSFAGVFTWAMIIVFVFWMAHRLTRPLRHFADASDRLGVDVNAPALPEKGSRELRRATRAFNQMQERIKRLVNDRTQMIAAISHDLKTMLTRLRLRAEFIDDDEQREKAYNDLTEMEQMLSATLSFAKDDSEAEERTRLDIVALLESLCADFTDMNKPVSYEGPEKLTYEGRPVSLKRAFTNLIENGVNYGEAVAITLRSLPSAIEIAFDDNGPGIPVDKREEVFTPFYRLETSRNRETGGTGLGLSVARTIIRRHGGDIVLDDAPSGGLRARVTLPEV